MTFTHGQGNGNDWIGLRLANDSFYNPPRAKLYVNGTESVGAGVADGSVTFDAGHGQIPPTGLAEGTYCTYLMCCGENRYQAGPAWFTVSACTPTALHVSELTKETIPKEGRLAGAAWVKLVDDCGLPAIGACVTGTFTGALSEVASATTDWTGRALLETQAFTAAPQFSCCITSVSGSLPYQAAANAATCTVFDGTAGVLIYMATDGRDDNPGTVAQPFATITRARDAVRVLLAGGETRDINVILRGGTYHLTVPLPFDLSDCPTPVQRITYEASNSEKVLLSGGRAVTGWTQVAQSAAGATWQTTLAQVQAGQWWFRELYLDNRRLTRARFPNTGYLTITAINTAKDDITLSMVPPGGDLAGKKAEIIDFEPWSIARELVTQSEGARMRTGTPLGGDHIYCTAAVGDWVFLEHAPAFLDQPDEWYLDPVTGVLTLMLANDIDPNTAEIIAPVADRLLVIQGQDADHVLRNLRFRNLIFAHTNFDLPPEGYSEVQAGHYTDTPVGTGVSKVLPCAFEFFNASGIQFDGCRFAHLAAGGIAFGTGCDDNIVDGCELFDLGGSGISLGWEGRGQSIMSLDWPTPAYAPERNRVTNSYLHEIGCMYHGCVGLWAGFTRDTVLANNEITQVAYTGITGGWCWIHHLLSMTGLRIEHNHIHHVMTMLTDGGGIYVLGTQPSGRMVGNVVHHIYPNDVPRGFLCNGLYFDQGSDHWFVENNVDYEVPKNPVHFNVYAGVHSTSSCDQLYGAANYFDRDPSYSAGVTCSMQTQLFNPQSPSPEVEALQQAAGPPSAYDWLYAYEPLVHPVKVVSDNLLSNGGFERSVGTVHPDWVNQSFSTNGMFPAPPGAYEGEHWASYSYGGASMGAAELYQTVSVTPGHTYRLSAFANLGGLNGVATATLKWYDGNFTGAGNAPTLGILTWSPGEPETSWTQLSGYAVPTSAHLAFIAHAQVQGYGAGINLDDCQIVDMYVNETYTPTITATMSSTPTPTLTPTITSTPTTTLTPSATKSFTPVCSFHTADRNHNWQIDFECALLLIARFNLGGTYSCGAQLDGYQAGTVGGHACAPHRTDYNGNWSLELVEMLRLVQLFNLGYHCDTAGVDGYGVGP